MVSSPYTKRHCSQWNVDQAVAILMVSSAVADELGIAAPHRVHPVAVVDSNAMVTLSARARAVPLAGVRGGGPSVGGGDRRRPGDVDHVELYSCFPSAVQIQAAELDIGAVPADGDGRDDVRRRSAQQRRSARRGVDGGRVAR